MITQLFSIRDKKGDFWLPKASINRAAARRDFAMTIQTTESILHSFPGDFELYYVGDFDSEKGVFVPVKMPEFICCGDEVINDA